MSITHVNNAQVLLSGILQILDRVETTDSGRAFRPTQISTCRAMEGVKLDELISKARTEVGLGKPIDLRELNKDVDEPDDVPLPSSHQFRAGAKAMFDVLLTRTCNNYSGNPIINKRCKQDNELIENWVTEALEEVSPEDHAQWKTITLSYDEGFTKGKLVMMEIFKEELGKVEEKRSFWEKLRNVFSIKY